MAVHFFEAAGATVTGWRSLTNADRFAASSRGDVVAVADGHGSTSGGGLAAQIAVELVPALLQRLEEPDPAKRLVEAFLRASRTIGAAADLDELYRGMGASLAVAWLVEGQVYVAHTGSVRVYLTSAGSLERLTEDHTKPTAEGAGPAAPVLTRALGARGDDAPSTRLVVPRQGQRLLLTTDGLHGPLEDEAMARGLENAADPQNAADALLAMARSKDTPDDATCVVALLRTASTPPKSQPPGWTRPPV